MERGVRGREDVDLDEWLEAVDCSESLLLVDAILVLRREGGEERAPAS